MNWQSSNPVLAGRNGDIFDQCYGKGDAGKGDAAAQAEDVTTVSGVVNKTSLLVLLAVVFGIGGYMLAPVVGVGAMTMVWLASVIIGLGIWFKLQGNPALAVYLAPVYTIVQGLFLGGVTALLDAWLASAGITPQGGLAFQAFLITISVMLAMIGLYYTGILRPTKKFVAIVSVATVGVFVTYMLGFVLSMFGVSLPYLWLGSAFEEGAAPLIGLGLNVLILGLASMGLIIDFGTIDEAVKNRAPKYMEWFCAFALIVTLSWIYFEAVKLAFRLALLFNQE